MLTKSTDELLYFVISHNAVLTKIGHDFSGSKIEVHMIKKNHVNRLFNFDCHFLSIYTEF